MERQLPLQFIAWEDRDANREQEVRCSPKGFQAAEENVRGQDEKSRVYKRDVGVAK